MRTLPKLILSVLVLLTAALPATAQTQGFSPGPWHRVATEHFEFVYPAALEVWALDMAERMEAVHGAVAAMVGFAPEDRVTVVVDDPGNVSNGSMNPGPLLYVWPTPPNPRSMIGENRGWGEILAVHEFAHAAHLTRPSRNPRVRLMASLLPIPVTNLMRVTPRWATEGYATYIEGRLTGSGRPHGTWRPAVLRTWALEGRIPTYGAVSGDDGYYGGAMAYLVGSAFMEWLVTREDGDETLLTDLWRRLTALQERSFTGAFTGVFGAPPDELYGTFTVDVTERALAVRDAVEAAGGEVAGELFQRYSWTTGDPAVSPDGEWLAVRRTSKDEPPRLVVISTTADTLTTKERERYERIFEDDPEDVEPVQRRPRAQKPEATLHPAVGQGYHSPAWLPDGSGILVIRNDVVSNGLVRPDLFLWDWEDGGVRRVTRGAAIREAAPSPDGTWAVGVRCLHGACEVVRIELDDGSVTTLAETTIHRPYYHPRVSPDGSTIVASVQVDGAWRLMAMNDDGSHERFIGPDDGAARFDAEFLPDGRLVVTSTRGGIHDLERLDPGSGEVTPLTRVIGAAAAPAPAGDSSVFFLSLHSRGWDLRRIALDHPPASPVVTADPAHYPVAPVPVEPGETFRAVELDDRVRPYGLGPRSRISLPMIHVSEDGFGGGAAIGGSDPIGRLSWQLQGVYGTSDAPIGGALRLRYRGLRPWVLIEGFGAQHTLPTFTPAAEGTATGPVPGADEVYWGGVGALELHAIGLGRRQTLRAGGSWGRLADAGADRVLGFGEYGIRLEQRPGTWRLAQWLDAHGAVGRSGTLDWTRWRTDGGLSVRGERFGLGVRGTWAGTDAPAASVESFAIGGAAPLLFDPAVTAQRVAMPALATGSIRGRDVRTVRAELYGLLPVTAFLWAGDAEGDGRGWTRIAGVEMEETVAEIPYLRLPATRIHAGLARVLNGPARDEWRAWLVMGYAP
ncbi:MAG: hypothetical protein R6U63_10080 [Longimicrobiales bacterium]